MFHTVRGQVEEGRGSEKYQYTILVLPLTRVKVKTRLKLTVCEKNTEEPEHRKYFRNLRKFTCLAYMFLFGFSTVSYHKIFCSILLSNNSCDCHVENFYDLATRDYILNSSGTLYGSTGS
uniref:Uncharacterized protein n=1 Tax=Glossina brevipalpis TaxID=37001 RepID=A0A1A9WZT7_9MUSC